MFEILATQNTVTAYASVLALMILNGAINFPSSQLLYIFLGYLTTLGQYKILFLAIFGSIGNTIGNIIVYELVRANKNVVGIKGFHISENKKKHLQKLIEKHGIVYIFFGKLIPGVKVFIPAISGFTTVARSYVYTAFFLASLLWAFALLRIGALFGQNVSITKWYTIIVFIFVVFGYLYTYKKYPELFSESLDKSATK